MKHKNANKNKAISLRLNDKEYDKLLKITLEKIKKENKLITISETIRNIIENA